MPDAADVFQQLFDMFAGNLEAAGGTALYARAIDHLPELMQDLPGRGKDDPVWISQGADGAFPGLAGALREAGIAHRLPANPDEVRDAALGIAVARLAIAETGSVLLHEPAVPDRSVSLMTRRLIVLCPASSLVPSLDEATPVLREIARGGPSYATLVTGPSRTADIERELAVGVQGPGVLQVVFLPDRPDEA